jgi:UDP-glucose 4-epimerase
MATYLVTGGAGFIGSHVCEALVAAGSDVIVLDDCSTGRLENLATLRGSPRLTCVVGSILDRSRLAELVERADAVVHLAAAVGVRLVVESPARTIETNVLGTAAVLDLAAARGVPVLLASSSEVYGKSDRVPFREDDDLTFGRTRVGRWSYGCGKAVGEYLALAYARERGLPVTIARLFNTVGPRQSGRYGMVLPRFVAQALAGEPLTVYGDGTQRRCFCDVGDVAAALLTLLAHPGSRGAVFNVGGREEVSIAELARRVVRVTGSASSLAYVPYEQAWGNQFEDMARRVPDLAAIRALIGFESRVSLDEMIDRVAADLRQRGAGAGA